MSSVIATKPPPPPPPPASVIMTYCVRNSKYDSPLLLSRFLKVNPFMHYFEKWSNIIHEAIALPETLHLNF